MRKFLSRWVKLTLAAASMVSMMIAPVSAETDFENKKDYYYELCSGTDLNAEEITVCKQFMDYVAKDQNDLQQKLDAHCKAWKQRVRDELSMPADWEQVGSGYAVTLRALESGEEIFSIKLTAATKVQAKRFCARWREKAPMLYQTVMAELGETQEKPE